MQESQEIRLKTMKTQKFEDLKMEQSDRYCFNADCKFFDVGVYSQDIPEAI